jgi:uncharacterized membrane protein YeaQ/YmgE (transglycosylase-associated protein family)
MSFVVWCLLGLVSGWVANRFLSPAGASLVVDAGLGIAGAVAGGLAYHAVTSSGSGDLGIYGFAVPVIGSASLLSVYHFFSPGFGKR